MTSFLWSASLLECIVASSHRPSLMSSLPVLSSLELLGRRRKSGLGSRPWQPVWIVHSCWVVFVPVHVHCQKTSTAHSLWMNFWVRLAKYRHREPSRRKQNHVCLHGTARRGDLVEVSHSACKASGSHISSFVCGMASKLCSHALAYSWMGFGGVG